MITVNAIYVDKLNELKIFPWEFRLEFFVSEYDVVLTKIHAPLLMHFHKQVKDFPSIFSIFQFFLFVFLCRLHFCLFIILFFSPSNNFSIFVWLLFFIKNFFLVVFSIAAE